MVVNRENLAGEVTCCGFSDRILIEQVQLRDRRRDDRQDFHVHTENGPANAS